MDEAARIWLKKRLKKYYWEHDVRAPEQVHKREFGVGTLDDKIKFRHKAFATDRELNSFLKIEAPYYISYSAAYYDHPDQPMTEKCWRGADLIFDLDRDMPYLRREPMEAVTEEARKLVGFLADDFGFPCDEIRVNFSGSKGYHIHVSREDVKPLSSDARRDILDYISGSEIEMDSFVHPEEGMSGIKFSGKSMKSYSHKLIGPTAESRGWGKRIYESARGILADPESLSGTKGIGKKTIEELMEGRDMYLAQLDSGKWTAFYDNLRGPVQKMIKSSSIAVTDDDKQVTSDISRLIRLPDTIHGGSGLLAKRVADISSFDPLKDALAFGQEQVEVNMLEDTESFDLGGQGWDASNAGELRSLPEYAAMYLILKGKARPASI